MPEQPLFAILQSSPRNEIPETPEDKLNATKSVATESKKQLQPSDHTSNKTSNQHISSVGRSTSVFNFESNGRPIQTPNSGSPHSHNARSAGKAPRFIPWLVPRDGVNIRSNSIQGANSLQGANNLQGTNNLQGFNNFQGANNLQSPNIPYPDLIGMALLEAPSHRLKLGEVFEWVVKNIPGYDTKSNDWRSGITLTLEVNSRSPDSRFETQHNPHESGGDWCMIRQGQEKHFKRWHPSMASTLKNRAVYVRTYQETREAQRNSGVDTSRALNNQSPGGLQAQLATVARKNIIDQAPGQAQLDRSPKTPHDVRVDPSNKVGPRNSEFSVSGAANGGIPRRTDNITESKPVVVPDISTINVRNRFLQPTRTGSTTPLGSRTGPTTPVTSRPTSATPRMGLTEGSKSPLKRPLHVVDLTKSDDEDERPAKRIHNGSSTSRDVSTQYEVIDLVNRPAIISITDQSTVTIVDDDTGATEKVPVRLKSTAQDEQHQSTPELLIPITQTSLPEVAGPGSARSEKSESLLVPIPSLIRSIEIRPQNTSPARYVALKPYADSITQTESRPKPEPFEITETDTNQPASATAQVDIGHAVEQMTVAVPVTIFDVAPVTAKSPNPPTKTSADAAPIQEQLERSSPTKVSGHAIFSLSSISGVSTTPLKQKCPRQEQEHEPQVEPEPEKEVQAEPELEKELQAEVELEKEPQAEAEFEPFNDIPMPDKPSPNCNSDYDSEAELLANAHSLLKQMLIPKWTSPSTHPNTFLPSPSDTEDEMDYEAKQAEIRSRLTRKQIFNKVHLSRLAGNDSASRLARLELGSGDMDQSKEKRKEEMEGVERHPLDPEIEPDLFDNLDELMGIPRRVVPFMHENQLAFRDFMPVSDEGGIIEWSCANLLRVGFEWQSRQAEINLQDWRTCATVSWLF